MYATRKLTQEQVNKAIATNDNAKLSDGENLYLYIKDGRGYFIHQFRDGDKIRKHSIGPAGGDNKITLAAARRDRADFMARKRAGAPLAIRTRTAKGETFGEALATYLDTHEKITGSTRSLAARFITAEFKAKVVHTITAKDVAALLKEGNDDKGPLWTGPGPNRGNRLRLLMLGVFAAEGVRPNPAEWNVEGAQLPQLMPDGEKYEAEHHASMPHAELPAFVATLKLDADAIEDRAGRLVILTALRRSEVLAAKWSEFDLQERVWVVPAERMKKRKAHAVPLTDAMIACLGEPGEPDEYVFKNKAGGPLSNSHAACDKTWLPSGFTLHGFRSTFADWASEQDHGRKFAEKVIDTALAHKLGDTVTRAYFRSPLFEARRELMEAWSKFATGN